MDSQERADQLNVECSTVAGTVYCSICSNNYCCFRQNSKTAVRLKVLEMLASVISTNSVLYRVSYVDIFYYLPSIVLDFLLYLYTISVILFCLHSSRFVGILCFVE